MIGSIRGLLLERFSEAEKGEVLVETAGIGYRIIVTPTTAVKIGEKGSEVFVYTYHLIREADQALYGFLDRAERICFEALLTAHGVGPSLALAVLGVHGPNELFQVVNNDDISSLCLVPGVGKKTATRLLVELKSVLKMPIEGISIETDITGVGRSAILEVQEALDGLGYSPEEIRSVLGDLAGDDSSILLREALQKLATA